MVIRFFRWLTDSIFSNVLHVMVKLLLDKIPKLWEGRRVAFYHDSYNEIKHLLDRYCNWLVEHFHQLIMKQKMWKAPTKHKVWNMPKHHGMDDIPEKKTLNFWKKNSERQKLKNRTYLTKVSKSQNMVNC